MAKENLLVHSWYLLVLRWERNRSRNCNMAHLFPTLLPMLLSQGLVFREREKYHPMDTFLVRSTLVEKCLKRRGTISRRHFTPLSGVAGNDGRRTIACKNGRKSKQKNE